MKPAYITMTCRQSNNQWSGDKEPNSAPKIPSTGIRCITSSLDFWDEDGILLIDYHQRPNYQHGVLFISLGAIEGHFEETGLPGLPLS